MAFGKNEQASAIELREQALDLLVGGGRSQCKQDDGLSIGGSSDGGSSNPIRGGTGALTFQVAYD